jgi:protein-S-isoprenylcysteine O-methyltransferase Ste14
MDTIVYIMVALNLAYWIFMENVLRRDEAKKVGFDSSETVKKEFGSTSSKIFMSQLFVYLSSLFVRAKGINFARADGFHGPLSPLGYFAIFATVMAFVLRYYAMSTLGKFFSRKLGIQGSSHEVVRNGPYAVVRNPGYAANVILFFFYAMAVSGDFVLGFAIWLQWMCVLVFIRIAEEETMLLTDAATGDAYKKYMQDVKYKLIPFVI